MWGIGIEHKHIRINCNVLKKPRSKEKPPKAVMLCRTRFMPPIRFLSDIQNHKVYSFDVHTVTLTLMIVLGSSVYIYVYVLT